MLQNTIQEICKNKNRIGIGTGKTVESILPFLDTNLQYFSSSHQTTLSLSQKSLKCFPVETVSSLDLYIDGCDYFDRNGNMIKGKGGSLTTEKLMCSMSQEVLIVVQDYKYKESLQDCFVPIEILPQSLKYIESVLEKRNIKYGIRSGTNKFGPVVTDLGNFIIDIVFDKEFLLECREICGIIEHGYFSNDDYKITVKVFKET